MAAVRFRICTRLLHSPSRFSATVRRKMKGLIDLIADIGFKGDRAKARDPLGRHLAEGATQLVLRQAELSTENSE